MINNKSEKINKKNETRSRETRGSERDLREPLTAR